MPDVRRVEHVLGCEDLDAAIEAYARLGFRLEAIYPADDPSEALLSGHGAWLRLERGAPRADLRLVYGEGTGGHLPRSERLADGTRVEHAPAEPALELPALEPGFVVARAGDDAAWSRGRAGMRYRDLLPSRLGGRFVVSHIRIDEGGPVPDYVHLHEVRFQTIYCLRGEVRVVYEDQGQSFVLTPGDCVLQPPRIRHRVLECSPGLEVLEVSSPAEHVTRVDHDLALPNGAARADRAFSGQRFVRHVASAAAWRSVGESGWEVRDTGIRAATEGLASVRVLRPSASSLAAPSVAEASELRLAVLCAGSATVEVEGEGVRALGAGDAVVLPPGTRDAWRDVSSDCHRLEVML